MKKRRLSGKALRKKGKRKNHRIKYCIKLSIEIDAKLKEFR